MFSITSPRRSVSWGTVRKTAREKMKKRGERKFPLAALFFYFSRAVFHAGASAKWTPGRG